MTATKMTCMIVVKMYVECVSMFRQCEGGNDDNIVMLSSVWALISERVP